VIASKIAAEAGDIAKGVNGAWDREIEMAYARKTLIGKNSLNWQLTMKNLENVVSANLFQMMICAPCVESSVLEACTGQYITLK